MRSEFEINFPGGDFVRFDADIPETYVATSAYEVNVTLSGIEVLERGNHLIGNAADELPQVSL